MAAIKRKSTTTKAEKKHKPGKGQSNPSCRSCNSSLHKHSNHPTRQITGTLHTNYCEGTFSVIYKMYHKSKMCHDDVMATFIKLLFISI